MRDVNALGVEVKTRESKANDALPDSIAGPH